MHYDPLIWKELNDKSDAILAFSTSLPSLKFLTDNKGLLLWQPSCKPYLPINWSLCMPLSNLFKFRTSLHTSVCYIGSQKILLFSWVHTISLCFSQKVIRYCNVLLIFVTILISIIVIIIITIIIWLKVIERKLGWLHNFCWGMEN